MEAAHSQRALLFPLWRQRKRETVVQDWVQLERKKKKGNGEAGAGDGGGAGGGISWSAKTAARGRGEDSRLTDGGSLTAMWVTGRLRVRQRKTPAMIKRKTNLFPASGRLRRVNECDCARTGMGVGRGVSDCMHNTCFFFPPSPLH